MSNIKKFNGETMYASEYYYGAKPDAWDLMLYPDAIKDRRDKANAIHKYYVDREFAEYRSDFNGVKLTAEERVRLVAVGKAYSLNKKLCDEKSLII